MLTQNTLSESIYKISRMQRQCLVQLYRLGSHHINILQVMSLGHYRRTGRTKDKILGLQTLRYLEVTDMKGGGQRRPRKTHHRDHENINKLDSLRSVKKMC